MGVRTGDPGALLAAHGPLLPAIALVLLLLLPLIADRGLRACGHVASNFRRERIPQSFGIVIVLWAAGGLVGMAWSTPHFAADCVPWIVAVAGFGGLGLIDDIWGDHQARGLRGHLRALLADRRVTTGLVKAGGGLALALWIGHRVAPASIPAAVLAASVIALAANGVNLLDVRPGRAGAVFLVFAAMLLWRGYRHHSTSTEMLWFVFLPALVVWVRDARGRVMIGDTGSNALGASLGLGVTGLSTTAQLCALALLVVLHVAAERVSFTVLIDRSPILKRIDRLTGVR
jgi:UDP-N-acetylmuramyl pentapeptide phosphotransferase/UDP-N-acetylglucosamine-1-phosphate transferase